MFEALRYKSEFAGSNPDGVLGIRPHYGPGFDSASNRNKHRELLLGLIASVA